MQMETSEDSPSLMHMRAGVMTHFMIIHADLHYLGFTDVNADRVCKCRRQKAQSSDANYSRGHDSQHDELRRSRHICRVSPTLRHHVRECRGQWGPEGAVQRRKVRQKCRQHRHFRR